MLCRYDTLRHAPMRLPVPSVFCSVKRRSTNFAPKGGFGGGGPASRQWPLRYWRGVGCLMSGWRFEVTVQFLPKSFLVSALWDRMSPAAQNMSMWQLIAERETFYTLTGVKELGN